MYVCVSVPKNLANHWTKMFCFAFTVKLLIGPRKVYSDFWGEYLYPPKR